MAGRTVFIDVNSACASPMNTGIQRIVRGLCRTLPRHMDLVPVMWSRHKNRYAVVRQGSGEELLLRDPFASGMAAMAAPNRRTSILAHWSRLMRSLRKMTASIPDRQAFAPGVCWFEPEIFLDGRMAYWERQSPPGVRRVAIFYDSTPLHEPSWVEDSFRAKFTRYMDALAGFDCVIAISKESESDLLAFWKSRDRTAADTRVEGLPCDFASGARDGGQNEAAARILVVATLEPRKNHAVFLDACELLWHEGARFTVELVGRCAEETGRTILSRIERIKSVGRPLEWRKHVSDAELLDCYRRCSFTVYPSLKEGFGLPVLESLWHGRPCVCGSNGALGEVAAGGGCVTVDQRDATALAAGMRLLLTDRDAYRRRYDEAIRRTFRTWDDYSAAIAAILTKPATPQKKTHSGSEGVPTKETKRTNLRPKDGTVQSFSGQM